jgi:hypothetical protein
MSWRYEPGTEAFSTADLPPDVRRKARLRTPTFSRDRTMYRDADADPSQDPLSPRNAPTFVVGQNRLGQWLAIEEHGRSGGLFCNKEAALQFASTETDRRPGRIRLSAEPIDLSL